MLVAGMSGTGGMTNFHLMISPDKLVNPVRTFVKTEFKKGPDKSS